MSADQNAQELLQRKDRYARGLRHACWSLAAMASIIAGWLAGHELWMPAAIGGVFAILFALIAGRARAATPPLFPLLLALVSYACLASVVLGEHSMAALLLVPAMIASLLAPGLPRSSRITVSLGLLGLILALPLLSASSEVSEQVIPPIGFLHVLGGIGASVLLVFAASEQLALDEERIDQLTEQVEKLTLSDRLTGLFNRSHLETQLTAELARAGRGKQALTIALIDVDRMGEINGSHGHAVGDAVLRIAASTLQRTLREYDQIGRWEGARFLLIMPGTSLLAACSACQRLRALVKNAAHVQGDIVPAFTASFGIAACDIEVGSETAIKQAIMALEVAEENGGDQVASFEAGLARVHRPAEA